MNLYPQGNQYVEGWLSFQTTVYNLEGEKIEDIFHNEDDSPLIKTVYTYGEHGELVGFADHGRDGCLITKVMRSYDTNGKLVEWVRYKGNGKMGMRGIFVYDAEGTSIERISGEAFLSKDVCVYDDDGNETMLGAYPHDLARSIKSVHDVRGNPSEVNFYDEAETVLRRLVFKYDTKGRLVEITDYCASVFLSDELAEQTPLYPLFNRTFIYDSDGRKAEEREHDIDGAIFRKTNFLYDSLGRILEQITYNADGHLRHKESFIREFDLMGNWIKETTLQWSVETNEFNPSVITYRTLTYY